MVANVASDQASTTNGQAPTTKEKSVNRISAMYDTVNSVVYASVNAFADGFWHMGSAVLGVIPNALSYADMISQGNMPRMNQIVLKRNTQTPVKEENEIKNLVGRVSKLPAKGLAPISDTFTSTRLALWVPSLFIASLIAIVGACVHLVFAFAGIFPNARALYRGYFNESKVPNLSVYRNQSGDLSPSRLETLATHLRYGDVSIDTWDNIKKEYFSDDSLIAFLNADESNAVYLCYLLLVDYMRSMINQPGHVKKSADYAHGLPNVNDARLMSMLAELRSTIEDNQAVKGMLTDLEQLDAMIVSACVRGVKAISSFSTKEGGKQVELEKKLHSLKSLFDMMKLPQNEKSAKALMALGAKHKLPNLDFAEDMVLPLFGYRVTDLTKERTESAKKMIDQIEEKVLPKDFAESLKRALDSQLALNQSVERLNEVASEKTKIEAERDKALAELRKAKESATPDDAVDGAKVETEALVKARADTAEAKAEAEAAKAEAEAAKVEAEAAKAEAEVRAEAAKAEAEAAKAESEAAKAEAEAAKTEVAKARAEAEAAKTEVAKPDTAAGSPAGKGMYSEAPSDEQSVEAAKKKSPKPRKKS